MMETKRHKPPKMEMIFMMLSFMGFGSAFFAMAPSRMRTAPRAGASPDPTNQGDNKKKKYIRFILSNGLQLIVVFAMFLVLRAPVPISDCPQQSLTMPQKPPKRYMKPYAQPSANASKVESKSKLPNAEGVVESNAMRCARNRVANASVAAEKEFAPPNRKQILYLHVGPPKTATTTIQQHLTDTQTLLMKDNIHFIGKYMPRDGWNCGFPLPSHCLMFQRYADKAEKEKNPNYEGNCTASMIDQLDAYYESGGDAIISDEVIGIMFSVKNERANTALKDFFNQVLRRNPWEIRVLVGYRPYFDFLRSQFSQFWSNKSIPRKKCAGKKKLLEWPLLNGKPLPGEKGKGEPIPALRDGIYYREWPSADELVDQYKPYADRIQVFDITTTADASDSSVPTRGNLVVRFFCDLLEGADHTCAFQKERVEDLSSSNEANGSKKLNVDWMNAAKSHDYDRIATAAGAKGLVNRTQIKRCHVTFLVRAFVAEADKKDDASTSKISSQNLPMLCPGESTGAHLEKETLDREMKLFPERDPHWETIALYEKAYDEGKLCSVDADKVVEMEEWKAFFKSIENVVTLEDEAGRDLW